MRDIRLTERECKHLTNFLSMMLSTDSWLGSKYLNHQNDTCTAEQFSLACVLNKCNLAGRVNA